jgi:hypothetical protein
MQGLLCRNTGLLGWVPCALECRSAQRPPLSGGWFPRWLRPHPTIQLVFLVALMPLRLRIVRAKCMRRANLFPKRAVLVVLMSHFVLISACYPRPHQYVLTQEFSGVLVKSGSPVSGAAVLVVHGRSDDKQYCENASVAAITSDAGAFHVDRQVELHLFTSLLNPPDTVFQITNLCFEVSAQRQLGARVISRTDYNITYVVSCDLNSAPVEFKQGFILRADEWGICRNDHIVN